ncbi:amino acid permease [Caldiplasma sukawensis]
MLSKREVRRIFIERSLISLVGAIIFFMTLAITIENISFIEKIGKEDVTHFFFVAMLIIILMISLYTALTLPLSLKVKFFRPQIRGKARPVYGFFIVLSIGIGSTLGSPLFILIPENALQYGVVSTISLIIAAFTSYLMSKVYFSTYVFHQENGRDIVGGPAFVRESYGTFSLRYFISRTSMWVANSSLAAYCVIIFFQLLFITVPSLFPKGSPFTDYFIVFVLGIFVIWFIINAFFEDRFIILIGKVQLAMTIIMAIIIVFEEGLIFRTGPISGKLIFTFSGNMVQDILINTGYLFILFFGFQEIMAFQRSVNENSKIQILGRKIDLTKRSTIRWTMFFTIIISSSINIIYSIAVMLTQAHGEGISSAAIPAFLIADRVGGNPAKLLMILAFVIATLTTFVPAFMAASRHLRSFGEDRIFPSGITNVSWAFTLIFIVILIETGENFLLSITDFMVLISLGLICLSALRYRSKLGKKNGTVFPVAVGILTFTFAAFNYFIDPEVVLFSILLISILYFFHSLINMERASLKLFVASLSLIFFMLVFALNSFALLSDISGIHFWIMDFSPFDVIFISAISLLAIFVCSLLDFLIEWKIMRKVTIGRVIENVLKNQ